MKNKSGIKENVKKISEQLTNILSVKPTDIVSAIKMDHEGLRNFLSILKNTDGKMSDRRRAYESFSALLKSHSEIEEKVAYLATFKLAGKDMHIKVSEGYVEHQLATDLMKRIEKAKKPLDWSAHVNVLSEIVEHHLKEEERDLLPLIREAATAKLDKSMLEEFLRLRLKTQQKINKKNAGVLKKVKKV
ncbi:MAG TPA: hemerythrin domain-containing protein [Bacteriovoracaceae bacterium]|nr:hemerythrin domain-containing protein [Bacteriovoracaceae bacterium]